MMGYIELRNLMDTTDKTVLRCYECGIPVPAEWVTYRTAIRTLITDGSGTPPTQPPYPVGT